METYFLALIYFLWQNYVDTLGVGPSSLGVSAWRDVGGGLRVWRL